LVVVVCCVLEFRIRRIEVSDYHLPR
jgi:hypothetical protein